MIRRPAVTLFRGIDGRAPRGDHGGMITTAPHTNHAAVLNGAVVLPDDPRYDEARSSFNLLIDQRPAGVVFPSDARETAAAVGFAQRLGLRVAPQATAHNQGPLGEMEDLLLVNVSR